jgi:hypothetical protein
VINASDFKPTPTKRLVPTIVVSTATSRVQDTAIPITPTRLNPNPTSTPMVIDSANPGVSISIQDLPNSSSGQGNIRIQFLTGNEPMRNLNLYLFDAKKDITEKWTIVGGWGRYVQVTNENGIVETSLASGDYALWNDDYSATYNRINGTWGITGFYFDYQDPYQMIIFPIQEGKLTDIKVSLARLEIGVINKDGNAAKGLLVYLYCQDKDVAGKSIPVGCGDGSNVHKTDDTGLTIFNVGAGIYTIKIASINFLDDYFFYDISLSPGEIRREILTIPQ